MADSRPGAENTHNKLLESKEVLKNTKELFSDDPVIMTPSPHCKDAQVPSGQGRSGTAPK